MKTGKLTFNPENRRFGIWNGSEWVCDGFHCGDYLKVCLNGTWVETYMEMSGSEWYLTGLRLKGKEQLEGLTAKV